MAAIKQCKLKVIVIVTKEEEEDCCFLNWSLKENEERHCISGGHSRVDPWGPYHVLERVLFSIFFAQ